MKRAEERSEEMKWLMKDYRHLPEMDWLTQFERDLLFRTYREKQDRLLFLITWEGNIHDLNFVFDKVVKEFDWQILEAYKWERGNKGRRDVYILTSDNVAFKKLYNTVLKREQDLYNNKWE